MDALDYGEELHRWRRILGEWSKMIGYDTTAKTFLVENFEHGWTNYLDANMATLFVRRGL